MSSISKRRKEGSRTKIKSQSMGDHKEFLKRITKTLYYGQLPSLPCLSLPVTEISCVTWSESQRGRSLRRLHADTAARIARSACVSPCALVLAVLYLERLRKTNPDYLAATAPTELFLVSLMIGNKFLQDDGEDEEVICSEWAASGGLELPQLKRLEIQFLNAIDWNVFVNEESFESGLCWLEKQVALKQAQLNGFFTYTDLLVTYDAALLAEALKCVSTACLAVTLGYLGSLLTLVASTLVLSQAIVPALNTMSATLTTSTILYANLLTHSFNSDLTLTSYVPNSTTELPIEILTSDLILEESLEGVKCCTKWLKYNDKAQKKNWQDSGVYDWKLEPWWSKISILNWLYHSSLINPLQRWLGMVNEYADLMKLMVDVENRKHIDIDKCEDLRFVRLSNQMRCGRQRIDFSHSFSGLSSDLMSVAAR